MRVLAAVVSVVLLTFGRAEIRAWADTPAPGASASCAVPDSPPRTLYAAPPIMPPAALAQNISGEVIVNVNLDADSHILSAAIAKTPASLFNEAALEATRNSRFQVEVKNCVPMAGSFAFVVDFRPPVPLMPPDVKADGPCTTPDRNARTVRAVPPRFPPGAIAAGVTSGHVRIYITLDAASMITRARVATSDSPLFNESALAAARASTFETRVQGCRYVPDTYAFIVVFGH